LFAPERPTINPVIIGPTMPAMLPEDVKILVIKPPLSGISLIIMVGPIGIMAYVNPFAKHMAIITQIGFWKIIKDAMVTAPTIIAIPTTYTLETRQFLFFLNRRSDNTETPIYIPMEAIPIIITLYPICP